MGTTRRILGALKTPTGLLAALGLFITAVLMVVAPMVWGEQAITGNPQLISKPPLEGHPFGTDAGGRDILARTLVATQRSVIMALIATAAGVVLGIVLGCLPAVTGLRFGRAVTALVNTAVAFPALLLTIFLSVIFGLGTVGATIAVSIAIAPTYARLASTLSASIAGRDFIAAAKVLGVSRLGILFKHIIPNIREPLIVAASVTAAQTLIVFASLSFLGLGVQPPEFDWGRLLNEGIGRIYVSPAPALAPGIAVVLVGLCFSLVGETLARALGVQSRGWGRLPALPKPTTEAAPTASANAVLEVRGLSVGVPDGEQWRYPVRDVSLTIAPGEIVGIVGESGSGKSLTCLAAAGLIQDPLLVTADSIAFEGTELTVGGQMPERPASRKIARLLGTRLAMVFQDPMSSLNPALTVGAQVAEIGQLHNGLNRRAARQRAVDRLTAVRIPDAQRRAKQYPHEFSGGMRQRAMIAMGLMAAPTLIIADEPTTALDVTVQREVFALLARIRAEHDSAVLLVSHDMAVITGMCSRVMVMYQGQIVEQIATTDLLAGRAQHPYTRALLAAVPTMDSVRGTPLATIPEDAVFDDPPVTGADR